nr:FtsX-like permease family protein [Acetatifactor muris]
MSVTLSKLSLRNARRQARDYLVYFVTVVMAAALLYSFNGLVFSGEVRQLSKGMDMLPFVIVLASAVVVCIFGWLVSYATGFMLSRRSRELGTYVLIGLTNRQVARLFFLENLAVGGAALVLGLALGGLLYQILRAILFAMFGLPYHFTLALSFPAAGLTLFYFGLIYLHALGKSRKRVRKMKIWDLIYFDRQNEGVAIRTGKLRRWMFGVSILLGVAGTALLTAGSLMIGIMGAGCLIAALFGFFLSFVSGVPAFFEKRPARKYQGQTLLVFRTLASKLATMGMVMAVISIIFTATLLTEGSGLVFNGIFRGRAAENACFDLYFGIEGKDQDPGPYLEYIDGNISVEQSVLYQVCLSDSSQVQDYISSRTVYYYYNYDRDPVLCWSDYAALRRIAGYPPVEMEPGRYLIHCMTYLEEPLGDYHQPIALGNVTLTPGNVYTEHLSQSFGVGNGRGYILVVPDEAAAGLAVHHLAYAAKTLQPVSERQYNVLNDIAAMEHDKQVNPLGYGFVSTKANEAAQVAVQTAISVFPMFYLALALSMTAATILTIQQLSETDRYRRQFILLRKLGMARQEMKRALGRQFALYYTMPAVPPVLIAAPFLFHMARLPEPGVMAGMSSPAAIVALSLALFFLIYGIYILLAYTSLRRSVLPE